jgi:predicted negative regulator of RcsB-dependent stress response
LLLWGDVLSRLRRGDEARDAYELAILRDPQSESARLAVARLSV